MSSPLNAEISRRALLRFGGIGVGAAALAGVLSSCTASSSNATAPKTDNSKPVRGGHLRAGLSGGSPSDTLDAALPLNTMDFARVSNLYDPIIGYDLDAQPTLALAESFEPNADRTKWTLRLKQGLTFHNGKTVTVDDVLFTFNRVVKNKYAGSTALGLVDLKNARKIDARTLELPCTGPYSILDQALSTNAFYLGIVPSDYDPKQPVGTGAFKYQSFTPGQESVFTANANYWGQAPYVDSLIITDYTDETAQLNALQSGQVDVVNQLTAASIQLVQSSGQLLIAKSGGMTPLVMRTDRAPFNDVRVRQALRLVVDRDAMNKIVFSGHGTVGNDLFSPYDKDFDKSIPQRKRDIEQAKALLAQAGKSGLSIELVAADVSYGAVQIAQVFADQAKDAGIDVKINKVTVTEFFGSNYLSWDFSVDSWYYAPYLTMASLSTVKGAPYGETHFADTKYNGLFNRALATADEAARRDIIHQMQRIDYDEGGYIIPLFAPSIDAFSNKVHGVKQARTGMSFGNFDFKSMWIS